ncbi:MAG: hypothetical protein WAO98_02955 [Alphaproteobacteria bacterium]
MALEDPGPPAIQYVRDGDDGWFLARIDNQTGLHIRKPQKTKHAPQHQIAGYNLHSGELTFIPDIGIGTVPYGKWDLSIEKAQRETDKGPNKGWVLVVRIFGENSGVKAVHFAFQSRYHGPSIRRWATEITGRLNRTMGVAACKQGVQVWPKTFRPLKRNLG